MLTRRGLLAGLAAGGVLVACSSEERIPESAPGVDTRTPGAEGLPGGEPSFSVQNASYEVLAGATARLNLVLTENDGTPLPAPDVQVWVRGLDGNLIDGPFPTTDFPEIAPDTPPGIHQVLLSLPDPGIVELAVVAGDRYGLAALEVTDPQQAEAPVPGSAAIATATPTEAAPLGYERICTEDPPCGMHSDSLDALLAAGRPVLLLFATPAYCQTAVCSPAVANLERVRASRDWGDVAFVHCEIYESEQALSEQRVGRPVSDWHLPTEPWLFAVDTDGAITERMDGPMLSEDMARLAEGLT